jgi:6-phosphogluconolactonase (cycloisomerase 2 family)
MESFALASVAVSLAFCRLARGIQQELVFVGSGKRTSRLSASIWRRAPDAHRPGAEIEHPSFLSISPNHKFLYAISEGGTRASSISAFAIDAAAGKLTFLNKQPAGGSRAVLRGS